jgi:hypothetical protein
MSESNERNERIEECDGAEGRRAKEGCQNGRDPGCQDRIEQRNETRVTQNPPQILPFFLSS